MIKYEDTRIPVCPILCRMKISVHRRQIWVFPYICGRFMIISLQRLLDRRWPVRGDGGCDEAAHRQHQEAAQEDASPRREVNFSLETQSQIIFLNFQLHPVLTWKANMVKAHTVTRVTPPAIAIMSSLKMSASLDNIANCRKLIVV